MSKNFFEWDVAKDAANRLKHGVRFDEAQHAFADPLRVIAIDEEHSDEESRYFFLVWSTAEFLLFDSLGEMA